MGHRVVDSMFYVRHTHKPPSDADWEALVTDIATQLKRSKRLQVLVKTDGGGPSAAQRSRLNEVVTRHGGVVQVAVLSSSAAVRGIVTALSWMTSLQIRAFGEDDFDQALRFIGTSGVTPAECRHCFSELNARGA